MVTQRKYFQLPEGPLEEGAGVYRIYHVESGKSYVGISYRVAHRVKDHARAHGDSKFSRALQKYGVENFAAVTLCRTKEDTTQLIQLETDHILRYNSIAEGYNVILKWSGAVGCRGKEFADIIRESRQTPEYLERMTAYFADEQKTIARGLAIRDGIARNDSRAKMSAAHKIIQNDPEHKKKMQLVYRSDAYREKMRQRTESGYGAAISAGMQKNYTDPDFRARQKEGARKAVDNVPGYRERRRDSRLNTMWITDGVASRAIKKDQDVPEGWYRGRPKGATKKNCV